MDRKEKTIKDYGVTIGFFGILWVFMVSALIAPDREISKSERRKLTQVPEYSGKKLWSGDYFSEWEEYLLDQFPLRDGFRALNGEVRQRLMGQKDNNGIYVVGDSVCKMEEALNKEAVLKAAGVYNRIAKQYFQDRNGRLYYSVIPDKNYYMAAQNGYPSPDYDRLYVLMREHVKGMKEIDVRDLLTAQDYYRTDLHWNQKDILPVANRYLTCMGQGGEIREENYTVHSLEGFEGAYYGQAALPLKKDTLTYLSNQTLDGCIVYDYEKNKNIPMYNDRAVSHVDGYDVFLGGPRALLKITNPRNTGKRQLVVFRDSFGSSIIPFFAEKYASVIAVDLRYIDSRYVENYVTFEEDCDVLFLHSSRLLNQYGAIS